MYTSPMLESYESACKLLRSTQQVDGEGGHVAIWAEVDSFTGVFGYRSSTQAMIAEKGGFTSMYRIYVPRGTDVRFHDVIKRESDGATFRVTHPGVDVQTPASSFIDWKKVDAERWDMPDD